MRTFLLVAIAAVVLLGISSPTPAAAAHLIVTVQTDRSAYTPGAPVTFTLLVTNPASASVTLTFPNTQFYDFIVTGADGREVWHWSEARTFRPALSTRTLAAGAAILFSESWNQHRKLGRDVPPGSYWVTAWLAGDDPHVAAPLAFTVAQPAPQLTLRTDRTAYALGERVTLLLGVTNPADVPLTLSFPSGQLYDFVVRAAAGEVAWRWSDGRAFTVASGTRTLAPRQTLSFSEIWDQRAAGGQQAPAGAYTVTALVTTDSPLVVPSASLRITQAAPQVMVTTDRTAYAPGVPVAITLTITNPAATPLTLTFPTDQDYDLFVTAGATGQIVWRWGQGRAFLPVVTTHTIPANSSLTFTERWDQRTPAGTPVGQVTSVPSLSSGPVSFGVRMDSEVIALGRGCTNVTLTWPSGTPIGVVWAAVTPFAALEAVWRLNNAMRRFEGFNPPATEVSDLTAVNRLDTVFICLHAPGTLTRPLIPITGAPPAGRSTE